MNNCKRTVALNLVAASALVAAMPVQAANGSSVAVAAHLVSSSCVGPSIRMQIDVAVTATSAAPLTLFVNAGGGFADAGTLDQWSSYGRTKAVEETLEATIPPGVQGVGICVAQPGSNGNPARSACVSVPAPAPCDGGSGSDQI